jgi:hypothetical protein
VTQDLFRRIVRRFVNDGHKGIWKGRAAAWLRHNVPGEVMGSRGNCQPVADAVPSGSGIFWITAATDSRSMALPMLVIVH